MTRERVRIPLQVGDGAARALAFGVLLVGPSASFLVFFPVLMQPLVGSAGPLGGTATVMSLAIAAAVCMLLGIRALARVRSLRPSDLVVVASGLVLEGGALDGFALDWRDVEPERWEVRAEGGRSRLHAGGGDDDDATGGGLILAETTDGDEAVTFLATASAVAAMCARALGKAPATHSATARTLLFFCPSCGAELAPVDAGVVACAHCNASAPVPSEIRERLGAARALRERDAASNRAVDTLLAQPSARAASKVISTSGIVMLATWIVAVVALYVRLYSGALRHGDIVAALGLCVAIVLGVACVMTAVTSERRALHVVTLGLGAVAPTHAGGAWACRRCGGPLPGSEAAVIACSYCGAHNAVGVDLVAQGDADDRAGSIASALQTRSERRIASVLLAAFGVAVLVGSALTVVLGR